MKNSTMHRVTASVLMLLAVTACTGKKKEDGVLRLPMITDMKTFDPALVMELYSHQMCSMVYEGLFEYHYLKRPFELVPVLAESMPEVSKDGLVYTIKIKKGVKFMDHAVFEGGKGREVKAKDFVYSWLRVADPKLGSGQFWVFDGHVKGLNEWRDAQKNATAANYDTPVEGFKALDDYTIQINLKHKYPQLLYVLAMSTGYVVPREAVEKLGKDFTNTPVGTGPYKLVSWLRNSKISFEKNPNFHGEVYPSDGEAGDAEKGLLADAGKPLPFEDKVEVYPFVESQPRWLNFMKGSLDYVVVPKDNFKTAIDLSKNTVAPELEKMGVTMVPAPQPEVSYTAFNVADPLIKKLGAKFRQAFALAIDPKKIIEISYNGTAMPAQFLLPPAVLGYDPNFVNPFNTYNVDKAKALLAEIGYPEGRGLPEIVYDTSTGTDMRHLAEQHQRYAAAVGIKLKVIYNQFAELDEKIRKAKVQMYGIAWIADYPDAENFLQLLYGPNKAPGPNGTNMDHAEYNRLFEQMRGMHDSPERRAIIAKMRDIYLQEMPIVVERHRVNYYVQHKWLNNLKQEYLGGFTAKFLRVDREKRAQGL